MPPFVSFSLLPFVKARAKHTRKKLVMERSCKEKRAQVRVVRSAEKGGALQIENVISAISEGSGLCTHQGALHFNA